jgi:hypothetical protein
LQVKADDVKKVSILRPHGAFSLLKRAPDDVAQSDDVAEGTTLEELLGLEAPAPEPPTHGLWTTEYVYGRQMTAKQFPVKLPSPEQIALYREALRQQAEAQGLVPPNGGQPAGQGGQPPATAAGQPSPATGPRPSATSPPPSIAPAPPPAATPAIESPFANETFTPPASTPPSRTTPQVPSPQVVPPAGNNSGASDPFTDDGEVQP